MKKLKHLLLLILLMIPTMIFAQDDKPGLDGLMRSSGRIYVVVAVMLTILLGLILYLVRLDRKINKLEKEK